MKNRREYILAVVCIILAVLQLSLILLSWLLNAANAGSMSIRSMLSPEGIRWFFGHFADNMATPLLVWLILIAIASGTVKDSGINKVLGKLFLHRSNILFRERIALYFVAREAVQVSSSLSMRCRLCAVSGSASGTIATLNTPKAIGPDARCTAVRMCCR